MGYVEGLHRNLNVVEILLFEQTDLPKGSGHHVVDHTVFSLFNFTHLGKLVHQVHVTREAPGAPNTTHRRETTEIDADTDGNTPGFGCLDHLAHLVFVPQVAGVEPQTVYSPLCALQSQLVVEVDVGDQRNMNLPPDLRHSLGCFHIRYSAPDNLTPCLFQFVDLTNGGSNVTGIRLGHRLDGNVGTATDFDAADVNRLGRTTIIHNSFLFWPNPEAELSFFSVGSNSLWRIESDLEHRPWIQPMNTSEAKAHR